MLFLCPIYLFILYTYIPLLNYLSSLSGKLLFSVMWVKGGVFNVLYWAFIDIKGDDQFTTITSKCEIFRVIIIYRPIKAFICLSHNFPLASCSCKRLLSSIAWCAIHMKKRSTQTFMGKNSTDESVIDDYVRNANGTGAREERFSLKNKP